jgi:transposase
MESKLKIVNLYRQGHKVREISRLLHVSRNTVRKIIRSLEEAVKVSYQRSRQPYRSLDGYMEMLEKLLRDNRHARPKRTGKALYEELKSQGYSGSYSAVMRYSRQWHIRNSHLSKEAYVPLCFVAGEAYQFDWSSEKAIIEGELQKVSVAQFVLCYSRVTFLYVYPAETQEMVLDSHSRAFAFFGGTPLKGIYDNMKTAVKKILQGKAREWSIDFIRLCTHYRIEPIACNPACAHEKGRVERQVQTGRQQFFSPMPEADSLEELNEILLSRVIAYNKSHKHPEYREKTLQEVFMEEKDYLVSAPVLFEAYKEVDAKVSSTCLVRYQTNDYSVHASCAHQLVQCRVYADKIVFLHNGREVGNHQRSFAKGQVIYDWHHYLPVLARKPGALRNGAPFMDMELPESLNQVRQRLDNKQVQNGSRDFALILSFITTTSLEAVNEACQQAIRNNTVSKDIILNILMRKNDQADPPPDASFKYPELKHTPVADCSLYNQLLSKTDNTKI